ncbi:MAG TPA: matrixin family metalloprotease [Polyangiaceae bacterium]|jgi:hypothetical protein
MQPNTQPKLSGAPPSVVIIDSVPPRSVQVSLPPGGPASQRSLSPIAASLHPQGSIFPSEDASTALPVRRRRLLGMSVLALAVAVVGVGAMQQHHRTQPSHPLVTEVVSGRAGLRTTPSGVDEHWTTSQPPAFVLDPSLKKIDNDASEAIINAFATWDTAGLGLPKASFTISSTKGTVAQDGVNRIVYAPITVAGMEDALAITIAYADPGTGDVKEADIVFNNKYPFAVLETKGDGTVDDCDGRFDLQNVATHEAGHVYGLGEDRDDQTTTMFITSEKCEVHKRALTKTDQSVMTSLYSSLSASSLAGSPSTSSSSTTSAGCGGATVASRAPAPGSFGWVLAAVVALVPLRRRRAS